MTEKPIAAGGIEQAGLIYPTERLCGRAPFFPAGVLFSFFFGQHLYPAGK